LVTLWPAYGVTYLVISGSAFSPGLPFAGKSIFWAASWVCTLLSAKLWAHTSRPPAMTRMIATTSPPVASKASNVLRRIFVSFRRSEPVGSV
jgi:hypothetical protein